MDGFGGVDAEGVERGEHPAECFVAGESAVEEDVDEAGVVLGDAVVVEEECGDRGLAGCGDGEEVVVADECTYPVGGDSEVSGDLVDGEGVGSVGQGGARGQR